MNIKKIKLKIIANKVNILLGIAVAAYSIIFSYLSIERLWSFASYYYDLGIMDQVVSNTTRGLFLVMTNQDFGMNMSRFAIHFDAILAFLAPLYFLYSGPESLLIFQSVSIALAAIPLFLIAKDVLKNQWIALGICILYLLYFPLEQANLFDYHSVTLLPLCILSIFYFMWKKKYFWMIIVIFFSLLIKEEVGLTVFLFGIYIAFFQKNIKMGALISVIGISVFAMITFGVIPYFRQGDHFALKYFDDTPWTIIKRIFFMSSSYEYIFQLLLPTAFIGLFAPLYLLFAGPEILINLASSNANLRELYYHYTSGIAPVIFIAMIFGVANLMIWIPRYFPTIRNLLSKTRLMFMVIAIVFICSIFSFFHFGNVYQANYSIDHNKLNTVRMWQQRLQDPRIIVCSSPQLAPFFTQRTYYFDLLPDPAYQNMGLAENDIIRYIYQFEKADYVVIAESEVSNNKGLGSRAYQALLSSGKFTRIFDANGIEVFKKYTAKTL